MIFFVPASCSDGTIQFNSYLTAQYGHCFAIRHTQVSNLCCAFVTHNTVYSKLIFFVPARCSDGTIQFNSYRAAQYDHCYAIRHTQVFNQCCAFDTHNTVYSKLNLFCRLVVLMAQYSSKVIVQHSITIVMLYGTLRCSTSVAPLIHTTQCTASWTCYAG